MVERVVRCRGRRLGLVVCAAAVAYLGVMVSCARALPDGRAYELVSPVAKNGTGVVSDSQRTRAAADGNALQFVSLGAFADAMGTGIATDYVSERAGLAGTPGWSTHAITPPQSSTTYDGIASGFEPYYAGEFSPDLSTGVFFAESPLTADPSTANVPNLYLRTDLLTPGAGAYELITHCPLCDATSAPLLAPRTPDDALAALPLLAWMSPDGGHVAFESRLRLTADTPTFLRRSELYEWDGGTVTLVGRVPRGAGAFCDDVNGPACVGSQFSFAGQGAINDTPTPDVVSDGSDGHTRVFFTFPTTSGLAPNPSSVAGQLYMRVDGTSTTQLNASERRVPDAFAPATFLDASTDGERVLFMSAQALTDDAPVNGDNKIYMYDATKPPSASDRLTFINADHEPGDGSSSNGRGVVGLSDEGKYVYFVADSQIVGGQPLLSGTPALYLWHDGVVRYIRPIPGFVGGELFSTGGNVIGSPRQSRVSPDGRWLLYRTVTGSTRQLYLYSADNGVAPVCVACSPSGEPPTADVTDVVRTDSSATKTSWHKNHALADDGSVFFSTAQALSPEDVNGRVDVYEYEPSVGRVFLISTGTSPDNSWYMDASADGSNVFFTTRQQLVGWDTDEEYDVYDARIRGGFPEPPTNTALCAGNVCQGQLVAPPIAPALASEVFHGVGNAGGNLKPKVRPCRKGFVHKRVRGRLRCVKRPRPRRRVKARPARTRADRAGQRRTA